MTGEPADASYDPAFFSRLSEVEDRHFWFRARNQVLASAIRPLVVQRSAGYRVLEVGCGTGFVLRMLESVCEQGIVVGMDLHAEALRIARRRTKALLVQGDMDAPPFGAEFDLVGLFDVMEHVRDDRHLLLKMRGLLREGGRLVATVPAHPGLWSYFDVASCHVRRYRQEELVRTLRESGYEVERATHFMAALSPLIWLGRRLAALPRWRAVQSRASAMDLASRELRIRPLPNQVLARLVSWEPRWLTSGRNMRQGASLLAVARTCRPISGSGC